MQVRTPRADCLRRLNLPALRFQPQSFTASVVLTMVAVCSAKCIADDLDLSQYYGFQPVEVFKVEDRSQYMRAGDVNHDGLTDLVLADNSHSRIDLLLQRKTRPSDSELAGEIDPSDVNAVAFDWRFEHEKLPVDRQVAAVALGDFNGDGRTDVAYFGLPDRLVVRFQPEAGEWTQEHSIRVPDVTPLSWILDGGDLNGDGRDDLVLVGKIETYLLYQSEDGKLPAPERLMNTSDKLALARIDDFDGDGRNDLIYLADTDGTRWLCVRLQGLEGRLGPELQFELKNSRSVSLHDIDEAPGVEVLSVSSQTGRLEVRRLKQPADDKAGANNPDQRLVQYGFGETGSGRDRDLAVADLDGDGLADVVVTDPETARVLVFRQHPEHGLDLGTPYPGLLGATQVRAADLDGQPGAEVVVLSTKEKTLGVSRFAGGRLTFPQAVPVSDEPVALELADLDGNGPPEIVYCSRKRDGRSSLYTLRALGRTDEGWTPGTLLGGAAGITVDLPGTPDRLLQLDANRDQRPDFLVFFGADRPPLLLVTDDNGVPRPVQASEGIQLGDVAAGAVFLGREDAPLILVAQDKFARNLVLDENGRWQVDDQYNAAESNARIAGAAALDLDGEPGDEIVLVDTGVGRLRILRRQENLYQPWREVDIGSFPYMSTRVADLTGDGRDDLLLFGRGRFGVLQSGRRDATLAELASYQTKLDRAFYSDSVAGDLNSDGRADVVVFDVREHFVEVLDHDPQHGLRRGLHFKLFDEKSFTARDTSGIEPRESLIADLTGDGLPDLILLCHDRVLLYPQHAGQ